MLRGNGFYTNNFDSFWLERVRDTGSPPVIISGLGFDPRSLLSAKLLKKIGITPEIIPIDFSVKSTGDIDLTIEKATQSNLEFLKTLHILTSSIEVPLFDDHGRPVGGRTIVNEIHKIKDCLDGKVDLIIDIGGLPRSLFSPLLSYLIKKQPDLKFKNLHVSSMPSEVLDSAIITEEFMDANYMHGFSIPSSDDKIVWIPIIGKNAPNRLRAIYNKIEKNCIETCPVLPFRSTNPRQVDDLLLSLKEVLFNEIRTFNNNIIYIDHRSPFLVYREIIELSRYYKKLLKDLPGDVKVLITPIDDKNSCVGAVLAAVEEDLPVMYADTARYSVPNASILLDEIVDMPLEIWISGEAYE